MEGNNRDSLQGLKLPLIKYILLQNLADAFLRWLTLIDSPLYSSVILFEDNCEGLLWDSMHLEDNTFGRELTKKRANPRRRVTGKFGKHKVEIK